MFTEKELKCINFVLTKATKSITSRFDFINGLLLPTKSKHKLHYKFIHMIVLASNAILGAYRFPEILESMIFQNIVLLGMCFTPAVAFIAFEVTLLVHQDEVVVFFNKSLFFNRDAGSTYILHA
jgi:hypothetical protein